MQDELTRIQRTTGTTFVHVTHDQEEAMALADAVVVLSHGRVEDHGPPERVYLRPASLFSAGFMGDSNVIEGEVVERTDVTTIVETPFGRIPVPDVRRPRSSGGLDPARACEPRRIGTARARRRAAARAALLRHVPAVPRDPGRARSDGLRSADDAVGRRRLGDPVGGSRRSHPAPPRRGGRASPTDA